MHIKQSPEDFTVEELTDIVPTEGLFALYRLDKRGWTTPDALQVVKRRWQLHPYRVSYGGLKDRHAHTIQYLTVMRGPQRQLNQQGIHVSYLGQVAEPYTSKCVRANRFTLTIRDMTEAEAAGAVQALDEVRAAGVPNYFDDQRFGSVSPDGQFVARHMILGEYEAALRLALAAPYRYDRAPQKQEKATLRAYWRDWPRLMEALPRGHARSLVEYLTHHPDDFRGALVQLRPELRGLYLSAYQSHLWNHTLADWLRAHVPAEQLISIPLRLGEMPMPRALNVEQREMLSALRLPLPSSRLALEDDDPRRAAVLRVLAAEGLQLEQLKLKDFREMFFSRGERAAQVVPQGLEGDRATDELHRGRFKLTLRFDLPRGSYATLLVKRITRLDVSAEE